MGCDPVPKALAHLSESVLLNSIAFDPLLQLLRPLATGRSDTPEPIPGDEIISQRRMDVGQPQDWKAQPNFFRRRALQIMV